MLENFQDISTNNDQNRVELNFSS